MKQNKSKLKTLMIILLWIFAIGIFAQDKEIIGFVKKENIDNREIIVFITENNEKYEIIGKLQSFLSSFYNNQKIKILGKITNFTPEEKKEKKLSGYIEVKEIIVTIQ